MSARSQELAQRRQTLVEEARLQRRRLGRSADAFGAALSPSAIASRLIGGLREHPALALLSVAGAAGLRKAGVGRYLPQLLLAWRTWRAARDWLRR